MIYYIFYDNKVNQHNIQDVNVLCETQFSNVWMGSGYTVLRRIIESGNETILDGIVIKRSDNKTITIESFLEEMEGKTIIEQK